MLTHIMNRIWLALLALFWIAGSASAQSGPPFACDGSIYQVQSGQLRIFDPITSTYQNVGPRNGSYNATGFNILDNYAYASQGGRLIRISGDGTIETVFNLGFGSFSGDVDFSNNFWLRRNNNSYRRIDIATGAVATIDFTGPGGGPADVAYDQFGGDEYLIGFSGGGFVYRYNITTQVKERISVPGLPGGGYGATWTDSTGRLFTFSNNNGRLYEVTDYYTSTPTFTQVGIGVPSGNNDGFSCSLAPFPNLAPLAFDDDFTTPVNTPVSGNVIADNGNGMDNDPEGGAVTANPVPLVNPSNGTVTLAPDGSFTYTPNPNFFGVDAFEYEISDAAGLTATAVVTITIVANPDYTLTKTETSGAGSISSLPETLTYDIVITNTGDIPLTNVVAADTLPDGSMVTLSGQVETGAASNTPGQLDLGETWTYSTSYTVTQADLDGGGPLVNSVSVTTDETGIATKTDSASNPVSALASFSIDKSVGTNVLSAPGTLTYTITVVNTGDLTLTGVSLVDQLAQNGAPLPLTTGPTLAGDVDSDNEVDVGETWVYTATFAAGQDQIDSGADIVNLATFDTDQTPSQSDNAVTNIARTPSFDVVKTSDTPNLTAPGVITYQIAVTNTGNTVVTGLSPTDTLTQGATTLALTSGLNLSGDTDLDGNLDVGESWLYTGTFAAGQDEIDDGANVVNDISISSTNAGTETSQTSTTITQTPAFTIEKNVDVGNLTTPGTLNYTVVVENTGNVTLTGVSFTDSLIQSAALTPTTGPNLSGDLDNDGELDVGETWTYTLSFDALQTQIDDGGAIVNTATFDSAETPSDSDSATTTITQTDNIALAKAVRAGDPTSFSTVGDVINFTYTVTNTGNTTLVGPITIDDDEIGNGLACVPGNLLPGASATCDHPWSATQPDLNAGSVTNSATAEDSTGLTSPVAQATVTANQMPELSISKAIVAPIPAAFVDGEVLNYEYLVTNTGNVTLAGPVEVTDNLTTVSCPLPPGGVLLPTASVTCMASYTITTNDIQLGSTTNVASAEASFNGNPVVSPSDSAIFPVGAAPVIDLQKSAPAGLTVDETTDTITYSYRIENVPPPPPAVGAALTETIFINDDKFASPILCYDPVAEGGNFNPGDVHICTAVYTVTQADLDAGEVVNEATANTVFAPSSPSPIDVVSNIDTVTVPVDAMPELTVAKTVTAGPNPAEVGDTVSYQITATNTGNQTLGNVVISDPMLGALACDISAPVTLNRTEVLTCTGSYVVQQSDVDDQTVGDASTAIIENTATAAANDPAGDAIPPAQDSVTHPVEPAVPAVTLLKQLFPDPSANPAYTNVGDTVRYSVTVTNSGNATLTTVDVTDSLVPGACTVGPLAPLEFDSTCIFDYVVDQDDIDAGSILNEVTGSAQPSNPGSDPVTGDDDLTSPGPAFAGGLTVVKSGSLDLGPDGIATVGDVINYAITVTNSGNVTLTDIAITDPGADTITYAPAIDTNGNDAIDSLAPTASAVVTATHLLTQDDIDAGTFVNSAMAEGFDPSGSAVSDISDSSDPAAGPGGDDPTITPIPRDTGLTVDKSFTTTGNGAGDTVTYSYEVTNTGNVTLSNVTLTDDHTSASGTQALTLSNGGVIASILPGQTATLTATYVITQEDVDDGSNLTNIVTVTGSGPAGTPPASDTDTETVPVEASAPALEVLKTVRSQTGSTAGDTVLFEVTVENTGNVTLTGVTLTDTLTRTDGGAIAPAPTPAFESGDGGQINALEVTETWVYTVTYVLTQADIDAGGISNSVLAEATAPDGTDVDDTSDNGTGSGSDPTVVSIPPMPAIEAVKTITSSTIEVGQTVTFEIAVENTGNVTLTSVGIASDTLTRADGTVLTLAAGPTFAGADMGSASGTLQVGETATYSASYVLVQADIDAGGIANTATAQGTPPFGSVVTDVSDDNGPGSDPTVLDIPASPVIDLVKSLANGGPSFDTVGDVLGYEFEITNLGNVTLSAPYNVADPLITDAGGAVTCPTNDIAPGASIICTGSYSVTQDDLDNGQVDNTATATVGAAAPVSDDESVPAQQNPELSLVKTPASIDAADFIVGAVATYTFTTTNTGNVTITDPVTISDPLIPAADITCDPFPPSGLAPLATYECTGTYTINSDDVRISSVTNVATASAGPINSPTSTATIPNAGTPALTIEKALINSLQPDGSNSGGLTFDEVGDQLEFEFTVTNSGQVSFANQIDVIDTFFASPIACFVPDPVSNPDLIPGETTICTAIYSVTQDDLDAGQVLNEAYARTEFGAIPTIVQSPPDSATSLAAADPMFSVVKTADRPSYAAVGETVTYGFTVTNTGNQTLSNVEVTDPLIPGLTCEAATLAVGDQINCSAPYTITQADIDAGGVTNIATATGLDPFGSAIPDATDTVSITGPSVPPTLSIRKIANPDPFGAVGSAITYTFEVTNTSIYTMSNIVVTDPLPGVFIPFSCAVPDLAPNAVNSSCQVVVPVTQDMVDAGSLDNTATVVGEDPFGNTATDSDTINTAGPAENPAVEAQKVANVTATTLGAVVNFTVTVENPGNVSIGLVTLTDQMFRNDGTLLTLDSPFSFVAGDFNNDGRLNPTEIWTYEAPYTITQDDINAGGFSNTVIVDGQSPAGTPVSDVTDDGDDTDGNTTDDPTVVDIVTDPVLQVTKLLTQSGTQVFDEAGDPVFDAFGNLVFIPFGLGDELVFEIQGANVGNVDIFNVMVADTLLRADGTDISADIFGPTRTPNPTDNGDMTLDPGEYWSWEVRYTITQDDVDAGGVSNGAIVSGEDFLGEGVSDLSDDGDDSDGNPVDDPTTFAIAPAPALEAVKTVVEVGTAAGEDAVFEIAVTNTGNVTLSGLSLADTMTNLDGDPVGPLTTTVSGVTGGILPVGATATYTVSYTLTQADVDSGGLSNTATAAGTTPAGLDLSDVSDDGDDTDGNTLDDPTVALIGAAPSQLSTKSASIPDRIGPDQFVVTFTMTTTNTGNVTLTNLRAIDDLTGFVAPATLTSVSTPDVSGLTTGSANTGYDGVSDTNMLSTGASLAPGETVTMVLTVEYSTVNGFPGGVNTLIVGSDQTPDEAVAVATIADSATADIFATKTATPTTAVIGDTITYTLTFLNRLSTIESNVSAVDALPAGVVYTPGTATIDGTGSEPEIVGRSLVWEPLTLAPNQTLTISFQARTTGGVGEYVNQAYMQDSGGNLVSNVATATITRRPEAVFDCADVIGKVFDDRNGNGRQDGIEEDREAVTVQDYFSDKFEQPEGPESEPGLPNVRLSTVTGTLITTDEFGRFSVPCAELPAEIGSNFQLKLDTRTLPSGYHVTTENPRNVRVTPGRLTKLNFGATLATLIEIDLTAAAFNGADPSAALSAWLPNVIAQADDGPTVLRLTYYRGGEDVGLARERVERVEKAVRDLARAAGRDRLTVEHIMHRIQ